MRILLDTHILLWTLADSSRLSKQARQLINNATEVYVSTASYWELAIKINLGKLNVDLDVLCQGVDDCGMIELPISREHTLATLNLPLHHKDPFDRLIVAAAMCEPMRLLSADAVLKQYTELVIHV